jgi:hypothetical protein
MKQSATHAPLLHTSVPPPQLVPSVTLDQAVLEAPGMQTWHALAGFDVPGV